VLAGEVREGFVGAGGGEGRFLLGVPVLVDEGTLVLPELCAPSKLELRLNVLVQVCLGHVVCACGVCLSGDAETVRCLGEDVLGLILKARV